MVMVCCLESWSPHCSPILSLLASAVTDATNESLQNYSELEEISSASNHCAATFVNLTYVHHRCLFLETFLKNGEEKENASGRRGDS